MCRLKLVSIVEVFSFLIILIDILLNMYFIITPRYNSENDPCIKIKNILQICIKIVELVYLFMKIL